MRSRFSIFVLLFTAICFVMASLEVNTESVSNTFGDQYDTYVTQDSDAGNSAIETIKDVTPHYFLLSNSIICPDDVLNTMGSVSYSTVAQGQQSLKKYILNSVLII